MTKTDRKIRTTLVAHDNLIRHKFFKMRSRNCVADLLEISNSLLIHILYKARERSKYTQFEIPKHDGTYRTINSPPKNLKILQLKLNHTLQIIYNEKQCSHGFVKDRNIVTNSLPHLNKRHILNIDLENFFPSIHIGRVAKALQSPPFNLPPLPAETISQIACMDNGELPQGSPLSPTISNIVAHSLDVALLSFAKKNQLTYTRYADDITLSSSKPQFDSDLCYHEKRWKLGIPLHTIIHENGFKPNHDKIKLQGPSRKQEVTGITVNEFLNVDRKHIRDLQATLRVIEKFGEERAKHILARKKNRPFAGPVHNYMNGKLGYVEMVRGKNDPTCRRIRKRLHAINPTNYTPPCKLTDSSPTPLRDTPRTWKGWNSIAEKYSKSIMHIQVDCNGTPMGGTAFMISKNLLATAGHNLDEGKVSAADIEDTERQLRKSHYLNRPGGIDAGLLELPNGFKASDIYLPSQARLPEPGEELAAIGFPHVPLRHPALTVKVGYVESIRRSYYDNDACFIQMSFQSPVGLSGSPLIDKRGFVVGIVVENTFEQPATPNHHAQPDDEQNETQLSNSAPPNTQHQAYKPVQAFGQATPYEYLDDIRYRIESYL